MSDPVLSDFTKKTLAQFGWTEHDGIPDTLGEFLLAAKDRAAPTTRTDVMIDAEKMLPADIETARKMISDYQDAHKKKKAAIALDEKLKNMDPAAAQAYLKIMETKQQLEEQNAPKVIDDREAAAEEQPQAEQAAAPEASKPANDEQPAPFSPPPLPPIILPFCPRCGWDMRMKYDVEVTDQDKEAFVAILLGNSRFKKKYSFLGDKFIVTIRSLLADENLEIHRQLVLDNQAGELPGENEWFLRMFEYRLACSIESVYDGDGKPMAILPPLDEVDHKPPPENPLETGLVYMRKYVNTKVLAHEVTRRLVGQQFRRFQRLLEALEAMAVEPSFWDGIG